MQMWIQGGCAVLAAIGYFTITPTYGVWGVIAVLCAIYIFEATASFCKPNMERLPYDHRRWITAISIAIVAIVCDRVLD